MHRAMFLDLDPTVTDESFTDTYHQLFYSEQLLITTSLAKKPLTWSWTEFTNRLTNIQVFGDSWFSMALVEEMALGSPP